MRVRVVGERHLPRSVDRIRLLEACEALSEWFGIDASLTVRIRCYDIGLLGSTYVEGCRKPRVVELYADTIKKNATRTKSQRWLYAVTLTHEFVHLSQEHRGSSGIPADAEEAEAEALERVYAPHVLKILQGRAGAQG